MVFTAYVGEERGSPLLSYGEMELSTAVQGSVFERLDYRSVGILQLGVLANQDNVNLIHMAIVPDHTWKPHIHTCKVMRPQTNTVIQSNPFLRTSNTKAW